MKPARVLQIALLILVLASFFLWQHERSKRPSIECTFVQQPSIRMSPRQKAIQRVQVEGTLEKTSQKEMVLFEGTISGLPSGSSDRMVGDVFFAADGAVEGLFLYVERGFKPTGGSDDLSIATLNADGKLDRDRSKAFLFFDPSEKLLYPATYSCTVKQPSRLFTFG